MEGEIMGFKEDANRAFAIIDNEELMRVKVFKKRNPNKLDGKVAEMKFLRRFIRNLMKALSKVVDTKGSKIFLGMTEKSWEDFLDLVEPVTPDAKQCIDVLSRQLEVKKNMKMKSGVKKHKMRRRGKCI